MINASLPADPKKFAEALYEKMIQVNRGVSELELYEFCYALETITPASGWASVELIDPAVLIEQIGQRQFFTAVQLKPTKHGRIVLDECIVQLTQGLMTGLVTDFYTVEWIRRYFYFDIRGFIFFVHTKYATQAMREHFGGRPYLQLENTHDRFERFQDIGYKEIKAANLSIDHAFIETIKKVIASQGTPILLTLVGPSAAGKTEIVDRLRNVLTQEGKWISTIEMDNFYKDREFRDGRAMDQQVIHFELFKQSMAELLRGHKVYIPKYDFILATSSHDLNGNLRPGQTLLEVEPADIMLLEGNYPFHNPEIADLIGIKIVYLMDDSIRLKRKWKRDIDYRKKYDPFYLCNRYFRTQFLRAEEVYLPMMEVCDMVVDTTSAALWVTPEIAERIGTEYGL